MVESSGCAGGVLMPLIMLVAAFFVGVSAPVVQMPVPTPQAVVVTASLEVTLGADDSTTSEQIAAALSVVQARLDRLVQGQMITRGSAGLDTTGRRIVVLLGDTGGDPQAVIDTLITTGRLELVDVSGAGASLVKEGDTILTSGRVEAEAIDPAGQPVYPTIIDNAGIEAASAELDLNSGASWNILIFFQPEAAEILGAFTASHIGSPLAVVLDGVVLSVPTIQARIDTQAVIAGQFDKTQAQKLAAQVSLEPLPVGLTLESMNIR